MAAFGTHGKHGLCLIFLCEQLSFKKNAIDENFYAIDRRKTSN